MQLYIRHRRVALLQASAHAGCRRTRAPSLSRARPPVRPSLQAAHLAPGHHPNRNTHSTTTPRSLPAVHVCLNWRDPLAGHHETTAWALMLGWRAPYAEEGAVGARLASEGGSAVARRVGWRTSTVDGYAARLPDCLEPGEQISYSIRNSIAKLSTRRLVQSREPPAFQLLIAAPSSRY